MPIDLTLYGVAPRDVMRDVYFREDYAALHARPDPIDALIRDDFRCMAAVRQIEGTPYEDMETPWGYGGPVALDEAGFWRGIALWRQRQADRGRVAEFVRLHPFLNPLAVRGLLDQVRFDRLTVLVDLTDAPTRRRRYNKGTRYSLRQAEKRLRLRKLGAGDVSIFRDCYEAGLVRNEASEGYYFNQAYYTELLSAQWADAWAAERDGAAIAVACFLASGPFAHYHLSGGTDTARDMFAHYLLLENAFGHYADRGVTWMHLGGGRTAAPGDSLFLFKSKFSPIHVPYYTGGIVFDRALYDELRHSGSERFLSYRFAAPAPTAKTGIALRPARPSDLAAFFRLKCDIDNIAWSGRTSPPSYGHLESWWESQFAPESARTILIAEGGGQVVGYAYVDRRSDGLEISVSLAASQVQRQAFPAILRTTLDWIGRNEPDGVTVYTWLYDANPMQTAAFAAAGFARDADTAPVPTFAVATGGDEPQRRWVWARRQGA